MTEVTYGGDVVIDRCTNCHGLWFDSGEADLLKKKWMGTPWIPVTQRRPELGRC